MMDHLLQKQEEIFVVRDILVGLDSFKQSLGSLGSHIVLHTPAAIDRLQGKSIEKKRMILKSITEYNALIGAAMAIEPEVLTDESGLLRRVLKELHLVVDEEVYENIEHGDVVEIYNRDFLQIYRSISFMNISGYTLLDLLSHEFYELFERNNSANEHLFAVCQEALESGNLGAIRLLDRIPRHLVREKHSESRGVYQIEFRHAYPLHRWPRQFYGTLLIHRVKAVPDVPETLQGIRFI